jgi:hypothetical protein
MLAQVDRLNEGDNDGGRDAVMARPARPALAPEITRPNETRTFGGKTHAQTAHHVRAACRPRGQRRAQAAPQTSTQEGRSQARIHAKPATAASHSVKGVVKSIDASSLVISRSGKAGSDMTFTLNADTKKDGAPAVGSSVSVRYRTEGSTNVATAVPPRRRSRRRRRRRSNPYPGVSPWRPRTVVLLAALLLATPPSWVRRRQTF